MAHQSARELALAALREWRSGANFADSILGRLLRSSNLAEPDRGFATELFYGILRNIALLDFWVASLRSGKLDDKTRDLLRLGLYQLFLLNTPEHAAVHETVSLANVRARSLVNAVLRNAVRKKGHLLTTATSQDLCVRESHPQFLIDRWTKTFGAKDTATLCQWNNHPARIYARVNHLRISVDEFFSKNPDAERLVDPADFARLQRVPVEALARGECYIQDPSTATACKLLDPSPGEILLDACAAPGGKTGYLAQLTNNQGIIIACDRDPGRLATLQDNLKRLGIEVAQFARYDWTSGEPLPDIFTSYSFDRILVDAPCSNTGVVRRRVDVRWRLTPKDFLRMQKVQVCILGATTRLLKPGGVLVYSTCSIEPEENEEVVKIVLDEFPFMKLVKQVSLLPFREGFDGAYAAKLIRKT